VDHSRSKHARDVQNMVPQVVTANRTNHVWSRPV
jgi:hypothetical protein